MRQTVSPSLKVKLQRHDGVFIVRALPLPRSKSRLPKLDAEAVRASARHSFRHAKPIEDIRVDDLVWAWDPHRRLSRKQRVKRLFEQHKRAVVQVAWRVRGQVETVIATPEHPFWVEGAGWVPAKDLQFGDVLKGISTIGSCAVVDFVACFSENCQVFNFEVESLHNYFIGREGVLVHNRSEMPAGRVAETDFSDVRHEIDAQPGTWEALDKLSVVDKLSYTIPFHEPPRRYIPFTRDQLRFNQNGYGYFGEVAFDKKFSGNIGSIDFKDSGFELTLYGAIDGIAGAQAKPKDFSVTRAFLEYGVSAYAKQYGKMPENLGGTLAWKNREMFNQEFVLAREMNPGFSATQVASIAFQRIPFGAHRVSLGYSQFSFEKIRFDDLSDVRGRNYTVPIPTNIVVKRENPGFVDGDMLADTMPPSTAPFPRR
jgi:hypothetical protein